MSKANSAEKVIRVAIKRVAKQWGKMAWSKKGNDGNYYVCLEGALFGFCQIPTTNAQKEAREIVLQIVRERGWNSIPAFNDAHETTKDEVLEVLKLGLIRLELDEIESNYISPEETESLLDSNVES